jgi:nucleoid-associated protein YgaU
MSSRNSNKKEIINNTDYYAPLRRGKSSITHDATPILRHPSVHNRRNLATLNYIWKYGDRLYKLAHYYYNDSRFWWVIAWYNAVPTEALLRPGDVIAIPLDLENTLRVLKG